MFWHFSIKIHDFFLECKCVIYVTLTFAEHFFACEFSIALQSISWAAQFPFVCFIEIPPLQVNKKVYELGGMVIHKGKDCRSGHYVSNVLVGGQWLNFNDSKVRVHEARIKSYKIIQYLSGRKTLGKLFSVQSFTTDGTQCWKKFRYFQGKSHSILIWSTLSSQKDKIFTPRLTCEVFILPVNRSWQSYSF